MITHKIVDFGNQRMAVVEIRNGPHAWLTVTHPLEQIEQPNWAELERQLMQSELFPIPEAS